MMKKRVIAVSIPVAILVLIAMVLMSADAQEGTTPTPTGGMPWDLLRTGQTGQFVYYDLPAGSSDTGKPLDIGDLDGNGCGDIAVTGQNASHPLGDWRGSAGHVRVIMNLCTIQGVLSPADVASGESFFTIFGAYAGDMAGTETYVGDFNGDGYDDLLLSAQNSDGLSQRNSNAGAVYILFGSPDLDRQADVDLRQLPDNVMAIYGAGFEDRFGLWVEGGDFDGDGYHDLLVGADQADGIDNARANAGEAWIIYGTADMIATYGQVLDLVTRPPDATRIIGADFDDLLGSTVWGGDLNADGYDDAIVSAALWRASSGVGGLSFGGGDGPGNTRYNSGDTYVIFGSPDLRGQTIDLADKIDASGMPVDDSLTVVYGPDENDLLGEEIATGDMDGDGRNDLILGTLIGDGAENNLDEAGEAWIIYTTEPFAGQMFDLAEFQPERAIVIYPDQDDSKGGDTLRAADLDQDGVDDLLYGAPNYNPVDYSGRYRQDAGMLAVIFGEEGGMPHDNGQIILPNPPEGLRVRYAIGANDSDMMAYAMAVYDVDGDGVVDLAPNAMGGDGINNDQINAGEINVISGAEFMNPDHDFGDTSPPATASMATATPRPTMTPFPEATVPIAPEGDYELGRPFYNETCAGCHGFAGEGLENLGVSLIDSPLVLYATDLELLIFLRTGRPADNPDNITGVSMPPSGGRPDWDNETFMNIIAYLRHLRDTAAEGDG